METIADGARLSALRELGVLDTSPEPEFDRFTALVSELLDVPISLVSLVDRDRQFLKSAHGLTGPFADAGETPLSHSFCQYPVSTGEPLVVADARVDPRLVDNLAVRDLDVVAYAGVPLRLSDGHAVGALCAIDSRPRAWTDRDLRVLGDLAAAVSSLLDLRRALGRQSLHDPLTGLPNRALTTAFGEQLGRLDTGATPIALAVAVNDLGAVNAGYGATHGDRVIELVARRIEAQLAEGDLLGRLSVDTFVVLRPAVADQMEAIDLAHRIRTAVGSAPVTVRADQVAVSVTVGLTIDDGGVGAGGLVDRAVHALGEIRSRDAHGPTARIGTPAASIDRLRLRGALPGAVRRGEITVNFQPIVELATGNTRGYEALARWRHPGHGLVGPAEFIPLAEQTGDIVAIGEHVLRTACAQLALWRAMVGGDELGVTVNFSPVQLAVPNIPEVVAGILDETGLPGTALILEITEGVFVAPGPLQWRNLEAIRALGVAIALDDFGTGYSTLSYLKRFPVDLIKIDRCFLDGLESDGRDAALMRAILAIGAGMELDVVAEGVETRAQRELLELSGCHWGQGFLFSEPRPADEIELPLRRPVRAA